MTTNQEGVHAAVRGETGTSGSYLADWHALFDADAITAGPWGPRLLAWINQTLGTSYTDTAEAMQAFAVDQGFTRWNDMNTLVLATSGALTLLDGADGLALDFTDSFYQADSGFYGSAAVVGGGSQSGYANSPTTTSASLLTYTSPSVKMTMGPSGTLRFGAHNLQINSENFGAYLVFNATVTTNTVTAPNGTLTADTLTGDTNPTQHIAYTTFAAVSGATYELACYAKAGSNNFFELGFQSFGGAIFNVATGVVGSNLGLGVGSITDVGGGWYRCAVAVTASSGSSQVDFGVAPSAILRTGSAPGTVYIWGAHIRRTPSDSTYLATTSAARYALPYEWNTSGVLQGIRVEEARTNLCLYSDDLTNAAWTKSNMTTAKTATGPDGVANSATTCTATAGNATALQAITSGSAARIANMYIKRRTGSGTINITQDNGTTWTAVTVTSSWTRVESTVQTLTNPTVGIRIVTSGDAVDVALFGAELGSFSTSPIPTIGSTVTRAADNITLAASAYPDNATAGTLFVEAVNLGVTVHGAVITYTDANNRLILVTSSADPLGQSSVAGVQQASIDAGTWTANTSGKLAFAYAANDFAACFNGGTVGTDVSGSIPTITTLRIGSYNEPVFYWNNVIKKVAYYPTRKSNAELQTLTSA